MSGIRKNVASLFYRLANRISPNGQIQSELVEAAQRVRNDSSASLSSNKLSGFQRPTPSENQETLFPRSWSSEDGRSIYQGISGAGPLENARASDRNPSVQYHAQRQEIFEAIPEADEELNLDDLTNPSVKTPNKSIYDPSQYEIYNPLSSSSEATDKSQAAQQGINDFLESQIQTPRNTSDRSYQVTDPFLLSINGDERLDDLMFSLRKTPSYLDAENREKLSLQAKQLANEVKDRAKILQKEIDESPTRYSLEVNLKNTNLRLLRKKGYLLSELSKTIEQDGRAQVFNPSMNLPRNSVNNLDSRSLYAESEMSIPVFEDEAENAGNYPSLISQDYQFDAKDIEGDVLLINIQHPEQVAEVINYYRSNRFYENEENQNNILTEVNKKIHRAETVLDNNKLRAMNPNGNLSQIDINNIKLQIEKNENRIAALKQLANLVNDDIQRHNLDRNVISLQQNQINANSETSQTRTQEQERKENNPSRKKSLSFESNQQTRNPMGYRSRRSSEPSLSSNTNEEESEINQEKRHSTSSFATVQNGYRSVRSSEFSKDTQSVLNETSNENKVKITETNYKEVVKGIVVKQEAELLAIVIRQNPNDYSSSFIQLIVKEAEKRLKKENDNQTVLFKKRDKAVLDRNYQQNRKINLELQQLNARKEALVAFLNALHFKG